MIHFLPKNSNTTSPTIKGCYMQKRIQIEAKKIVDLLLGNNITFYWKVTLLSIIMSDNRLK